MLINVAPLVAALTGGLAFVLYARDAEGRPFIAPRGGTSRNIVARSPGVGRPALVVVAHMDSARASMSFHPRLVGNIRVSIVVLNVALAAVPIIGGAAWVAEAGRELPTALWLPAIVLAAYLLFGAGLQVHSLVRMPFVAGANDNASGVEVLMRAATELRGRPVWFVVTGSEEAGMIGAQAFLRRHVREVGGAPVLNIDNVGAGRLVAASDEGILRSRPANGYLLDVAQAAGAEIAPWRAFPTDATVVMAHRLPALTLIALDDRGVPPHWHWPSDVAAAIDPSTIAAAAAIVRSVAAACLDEEARTR